MMSIGETVAPEVEQPVASAVSSEGEVVESSGPSTGPEPKEETPVANGLPTVSSVKARIVQLEGVRDEKIVASEVNCKTIIDDLKAESGTKLKCKIVMAREDLKAKKADIRKACKNACTSWNRVLKSLEAETTAGK